jgi:hypothetical protein
MNLYYCWGYKKMEFERVKELTRTTPTAALCEAWGLNPGQVSELTQSKRPMTIREAGALAALHGMKLEDVLAS